MYLFSVWLQLLSRDQQKSVVLKLHLSQFTANENQGTEELKTEVLWEEISSTWINITDVYYFMSSSSAQQVQMIWSSEKDSGYRHLYFVEKKKDDSHSNVTALTQGEWCCIDRPLYVDESRSQVYFTAKMHTPLESHFYLLNYKIPHQPKLLTRLGFSHTVTMNSPDYFVDCFSTIHDPPIMMVQRLDHSAKTTDRFGLLMSVVLKRQVETPPSPPLFTSSVLNHTPPLNGSFYNYYNPEPPSKYQDSIEPNGEIFNFNTSDGKHPKYAIIIHM